MSQKPCRIILTGGPGSGKSTIINKLRRNGYSCSIEAGRAIIQDQSHIGGSALPWIDPIAFAELMLSWELRSWHDASNIDDNSKPYFCDRGIPDIAGYLHFCERPIPQHLENAIRLYRYSTTVFIAPPWKEIYLQDKERQQTFDEAVATYQAMLAIYRQYNYTLIELPKADVNQRVKFIINNITSLS